jgi:MFS family permease
VFTTIWVGQLVSYTGSGLTSFALAVWAYQTTGSTTHMALISAFVVLPTVLLSPLAGAYVDRWNRRRALLLSDAGAGLSTLVIAALLLLGELELWHVYAAVCASSVFGAFRWPALTASMTQLVPREHFGRTSGLLQVVQAGQVVVAPFLAGSLMSRIHLEGVVLIDVLTFGVSIATLAAVRIPEAPRDREAASTTPSILRETAYGWTYLRDRPALMALLGFAFGVSLLVDMASLLVIPLVLAVGSSAALGTTLSIGGVGFLAGGATMSVWGGPRRPIRGVIGFPLLTGVCLALMGLQSTLWGTTICLFCALASLPLFYACNQVIWQRKVAAEVQGRVFAIRRVIVLSSRLVASIVVGPLADRVFEPLLQPGGALAPTGGALLGVGPGRGIALLIVLLGLSVALGSAAAALSPRLRLVDDELDDAVAVPAAAVRSSLT